MNELNQLPLKYALRSKRVVMPHKVGPAVVVINQSRISAISDYDEKLDMPIIDVEDRVVMPGLIDLHVHLNDPGRDWEGFASGTKSAVAGGVSTVVDMPLNSQPVTTSMNGWRAKGMAMHRSLWSNCGLHAGVTPDSLTSLSALLSSGCVAGKAFMVDSGIPEFQMADEATLRKGMEILAKFKRPLFVHAELALGDGVIQGDRRKFANYLASRPPEWEVEAIKLLIKLCRETRCVVHVVHVSAAEALPYLRDARSEGLPISVETCPHYLYFTAEEIADGATQFKCSPPIRSAENREKLWEALLVGDIDVIASDHSPCTPDLKRLDSGDFQAAWGGISSLQLTLPALYTQLRERLTGEDAFRMMAMLLAENPAAVIGLHQVGRVWPRYKADIMIWEPETSFVVEGEALHHRHKLTAYEGETLYGKVTHTIVNGRFAFAHGQFSEPRGLRIDEV